MALKKTNAACNEPGLEDIKRDIADALEEDIAEPENVAMSKYIERIRKLKGMATIQSEKIIELKAKLKTARPQRIPRVPATHTPTRFIDPRLKGRGVHNVEAAEMVTQEPKQEPYRTEAERNMLAKAAKTKAKTRGVRRTPTK